MVIAKAPKVTTVSLKTYHTPKMEMFFKDLGSKVLDFAFINVGNFRSNLDKVKILMVLSELESSKKAFLGAPTIADLDVDVGHQTWANGVDLVT